MSDSCSEGSNSISSNIVYRARSSIYVLPARVQLLSLPSSQRAILTHAVTKNVFFPPRRDAFFNFTENLLEITVIAEVDIVNADFASLAEQTGAALTIDPDAFRVLEIDIAGDSAYAGQQITEISAPLAKAGISIFYLSTYQTDYLLVKERRLAEVVQTLQAHHFNIPNLDLDLLSDIAITTASAITSDAADAPVEETTPAATAAMMSNMRARCNMSVPQHRLAMVGLNREQQDGWALRVLQLLFYPELLPPNGEASTVPPVSRRFVSYAQTGDGISLVADAIELASFDASLLNWSDTQATLQLVQIYLANLGYEQCGIVYSVSEALNSQGINHLYLSTYGTANILVNEEDLALTCTALDIEGHSPQQSPSEG